MTRAETFVGNIAIAKVCRSIGGTLFVLLVCFATRGAIAADVPLDTDDSVELPTLVEIIREIRTEAAGLPDPIDRVTFLQGIAFRIDWRRSTPQLDLILQDFVKTIGDLSYNSQQYIAAQLSLARVHIAREDKESAVKILRLIESLAMDQRKVGDWRTCNGSFCSLRPVNAVLGSLARSWELLGEREEALRLIALQIDYLSGDYPSLRYDGLYGSKGSGIAGYLIFLEELALAEELYERLVDHFLSSNSSYVYFQRDLIRISVQLEYLNSPDEREMFSRASKFFAGHTFNINADKVDGRIGLAWRLNNTSSRPRAIDLLDEVRSDVEMNTDLPNWQAEHRWLTSGYADAGAMEKAREMVKLYESELIRRSGSKGQPRRTLWTPLPERPLLRYHLFGMQVESEDLVGAEQSFIQITSTYGLGNLFRETANLAELNIRKGNLDRGEQLISVLDETFVPKSPSPGTSPRTRYGAPIFVARLYTTLSDAYFEQGNLTHRDRHLSRVWQLANNFPNDDGTIYLKVDLLNRIGATPLHANRLSTFAFNSALFGHEFPGDTNASCDAPPVTFNIEPSLMPTGNQGRHRCRSDRMYNGVDRVSPSIFPTSLRLPSR